MLLRLEIPLIERRVHAGTVTRVFAEVVAAYRASCKPRDILWNRFVARPVAALFLPPLARTRVTPNQITLLTLVVFAASAVMMVLWSGHLGLGMAVLVLEVSYVLDCVDGQLARLRGTSTPVGAHLDFLMDELKAFALVAAVGLRLWRADRQVFWLLEALAALCAVASAISLTTFQRRPEYAAAAGRTVSTGAGDYGAGFETGAPPIERSPLRLAVRGIEAAGRLIIHYPSYIVLIAIFNRLDLFLHAYLAVNAAYAARSLLAIARKLGRSA